MAKQMNHRQYFPQHLEKSTVRNVAPRAGTRFAFASKTLLSVAAAAVTAGLLGLGLRAMQAPKQLFHPEGTRLSFAGVKITPSHYEQTDAVIGMMPSEFNAKHSSLKDLIKFAYHIRSDDRIVGGPGWMSSEFFDVETKANEPEIARWKGLDFEKQVDLSRSMVQSLLADRFQLRSSIQTRELQAYALVVATGGSKLKEVEPAPPGAPLPAGAHPPSLGKSGPSQFTASAIPLPMIADWLSLFDEIGNHLIINETGLKGNYDFTLNGVSMERSKDPSITSIFKAIEDQLGLQLLPRKVVMEVLVIDHADRPPAN